MERDIGGGDTPLLRSNVIWEQESSGRGGQEPEEKFQLLHHAS